MKVADIARKLPVTITLSTLGGESSFSVVNQGGIVRIINSAGSHHKLDDAHVQAVYLRYRSLPATQRLMASEYVDPKWTARPNRNFSPYVARIISYIL